MGLLDRLLQIAPSSLSRFFFANSGSEAVDQAIKIARGHTGRQNIICFEVGAGVPMQKRCCAVFPAVDIAWIVTQRSRALLG